MRAAGWRHRRGMTDDARVVVGIDGSETSRVALRWALAEARLRNAHLAVVHGWHTPSVFIPPEYRAELVEMGRMPDAVLEFIDKELDAVGADADTGVVIERQPVQHFAARALTEASANADLVVVGRHGIGGFPHEAMAPKVVVVGQHRSRGTVQKKRRRNKATLRYLGKGHRYRFLHAPPSGTLFICPTTSATQGSSAPFSPLLRRQR